MYSAVRTRWQRSWLQILSGLLFEIEPRVIFVLFAARCPCLLPPIGHRRPPPPPPPPPPCPPQQKGTNRPLTASFFALDGQSVRPRPSVGKEGRSEGARGNAASPSVRSVPLNGCNSATTIVRPTDTEAVKERSVSERKRKRERGPPSRETEEREKLRVVASGERGERKERKNEVLVCSLAPSARQRGEGRKEGTTRRRPLPTEISKIAEEGRWREAGPRRAV